MGDRTYIVTTSDEPAAGLSGERADVHIYGATAEDDSRVHTVLAKAFAAVWGVAGRDVHIVAVEPDAAETAAVERTPEVVLQAMLAVYGAAALATEETYYARFYSDIRDDDRHCMAWANCLASERFSELRTHLARLRGRGVAPSMSALLAADYEARLRGDRPLDAPPIGAA